VKIIFLDFSGTIDALVKTSYYPSVTNVFVDDIHLMKGSIKKKPKKELVSARSSIWSDPFFVSDAPSPEDLRTYAEDAWSGSYDSNWSRKGVKYKPAYYGPDKECKKYLAMLVRKTGAKIVYTTTSRSGGWESCAEFVGLPLRYSLGGQFGVTPDLPIKPFESFQASSIMKLIGFGKKFRSYEKDRQGEILAWFKNWKGESIKDFVILDDDVITSHKLRSHWIPSIAQNGFKKAEYEQALKILGTK